MIFNRRLLATLTLGLLSAALGTEAATAQLGAVDPPGPGGWAPPSVGVRFGYDNKQQNNVLGAQVRLPVIPSGVLELMGSLDVTFLPNLKEYQYNIEGIYVLDGRAGGFYGGAGLGLRNTVYPNSVGRATELGYTAVIGIRIVQLGIVVPQIEYRWVFINEAPLTYQQLTVGVNVALWRHVAPS